ncbi:coproporphyrinogen III oxidase [Corynebacterium lizhenjunii]|uniref:Heme chaperone HemW n=1 Tax=Corynebacterium lizhenjunii TaxID=2709394 RepID=A0A7T0KF98_9CORY|nr:radical SAM family heme chaperone HemW [Corynebacterium lizhenjunii]QPK78618.1 coproporphyrinogen III oxidase [Corynebacterium lizhenjunii]
MTADFGLYIHVPFCATRCGYCDFNTYTPGELGGQDLVSGYLDALDRELELAAAQVDGRQAQTVFIGGGTPSLLGAQGLARILSTARRTIGLAPDAEVTTESNPESTSPEFFAGLREAGFTRISLGMQSAASHVLAVLERAHTPGRAFAAVRQAREAGFDHVNLDMIYGTPGESDADVHHTLDLVLDSGVDHVSAYSLIVEDGTRMARKVHKGLLPAPDEDVLARRYELIAQRLEGHGYQWYEVSNWALEGGRCEHNRIYWQDGDWWGAGPGAHSHLGQRRFFNLKHPRRYIETLAAGQLPIAEEETLTATDRHTEKIMLGLRLREGIPQGWLDGASADTQRHYIARGLLELEQGHLRLTKPGRLLADGIITDLLLAEESPHATPTA